MHRRARSSSGQPAPQSQSSPLPYPPGRLGGSGVEGMNDDDVSDRGAPAGADAVGTTGGGGGITAAGIAIGSWLAARGVTPPPPPVPSTTLTPESPSGQGLGLASGQGLASSPEPFQMTTPQRPSPLHRNPSPSIGLSFHQPRTPDSSGHSSQVPMRRSSRDDSPTGGGGGGGRNTRERSMSNIPSLLFSSLMHHPPTSLSSPQPVNIDMHTSLPYHHHHHPSSSGQGHTSHGGNGLHSTHNSFGGVFGGGETRQRSPSSSPPSPGGVLMGQPIGPDVLLTALSLSMADDAVSLAMVV